IGFLALCFNVKEGRYPPVVDKVTSASGKSRIIHAIRNYVSECFSSPIYWWMYAARTFVTAAVPVLGFTIFFPQYELGMGLERSARYMAWPSLVWIVCAYPVGMLIDRWGIFRVFTCALWGSVISYVGTFFLVQGPVTFLLSAMCTGILYWAVMLTQLVYLQALVHPQRVGQLSSANEIARSLFVMLVAGPFVGWFLHMLKDYRGTWHLPLIGSLEVGPYRFVNLILALLFFLALLCAKRSIAHWRKRGGPHAYMPPL
ncbi:MAG: MFS transporter, partial [Opitutaceae bacterium]|nr:MFS transporter [Opitutaceae bacterium]